MSAGKELLRKKKCGETLTATEWSVLARFHANRAVQWSIAGLVLAALAFVFNVVMAVLR